MKYKFSARFKIFSILLVIVGALMFAYGYQKNSKVGEKEIIEHLSQQKEVEFNKMDDVQKKEVIVQAEHQVHNKPYGAAFVSIMMFFSIATGVLFFYALQQVTQSGWSVMLLRIMEGIASFIPIGAIFMMVFIWISTYGIAGISNTFYHWMDPSLVDPNSPHFDLFIAAKSTFLNKPWFVIRTAIYLVGSIFFLYRLKALSRKLDKTSDRKDYNKVYNWNVFYIAFFALASMVWSWDWIMSIDPHWYSTLYMWYTALGGITAGISFIIFISVYLKLKGVLPNFTSSHLHDLAKYLFGFSLFWAYFWFAQFLLHWYSNIPEEVAYYQDRISFYQSTYFVMLIPSLILPLFLLLSSKLKENMAYVFVVALIVFIGHLLDFYNMIMPGVAGSFGYGAFLTIGAFIFFLGIFIFTVLFSISRRDLESKGNPFNKESEEYKYPYL